MAIHLLQNLEAGHKQTVLVYGTSLTFGGAWAVTLQEWLETQYPGLVTFINSGGSGENSDWGVAQLQAKVLDHHPDLVFIEFSYNDAHDKFNMPLERGKANLATIVAALREQNSEVEIVLQTMNSPWDAPNGNRSASVRPQIEQFNDNYRTFAEAESLPLLDHYKDWKTILATAPEKYQLLVPDGSHPTSEGSLAVTWVNIKRFLEHSIGAQS